MADQAFDPDFFTKALNLTKTYHRDLYPAILPTNPLNSAAGKVVLITGSSRGVGRACSCSWAEAGASGIVVTSRKLEDLRGVTEDIERISGDKTEVLAVAGEISKDADVKALFEQAKAKFGRLDVVIANAGVALSGATCPKIGDMDPGAFWNDFEVNVRGTHLTAYHYINTFGPRGTYINLTSGAASAVVPGLSSYSMTKYTCIQFVEYLAAEYPELQAFSFNPEIVKGIVWMQDFVPFGQDAPELTGAFSVWLSTPRADGVRGGYVGVNWDVEELEKHGAEIQETGLLKMKFMGGILGAGGYNFEK